MLRYAAFLRAINVGGHTVRMDDLRRQFEALGLGRVATLIASGNVIFESNLTDRIALEERIEEALERWLGYEVATLVRSAAEVSAIAAFDPFPDVAPREGDTLHILFLREWATPEAQTRVAAIARPQDLLRLHESELFWLRRGKMMDSGIAPQDWIAALGRGPNTARTANTVRKIAARLAG
ncbi:MAG: DUF1697 domain-containing protein [Chloroflexi bacterium]|nr:DUF1697 domain-containing protein [Chloroflexota bacterium]